jgi:hypothetical protein
MVEHDVGDKSNGSATISGLIPSCDGRHSAARARGWGCRHGHTVFVVYILAAYKAECRAAIAEAFGKYPPLIALLASLSAAVQGNAALALWKVGGNVGNKATFASAGRHSASHCTS